MSVCVSWALTCGLDDVVLTHVLQHDVAVLFVRVRVLVAPAAVLVGPLEREERGAEAPAVHLVPGPALEVLLQPQARGKLSFGGPAKVPAALPHKDPDTHTYTHAHCSVLHKAALPLTRHCMSSARFRVSVSVDF